jgi:hypothetical protein
MLAASCLSLPTINAVLKSADEVAPHTRDALALAMQLLDPEHPQSIVGWREELNDETLAQLLGVTVQDARKRLRGRATWTEEERARLIHFMSTRRAKLSGPQSTEEPGEIVQARLPDACLLVGLPFHLHTVEWRPADLSSVVTVVLTIALHAAPQRQARVRVTNSQLLRDLYALDEGRRESAVYVISRDPKRPGMYRLHETCS